MHFIAVIISVSVIGMVEVISTTHTRTLKGFVTNEEPRRLKTVFVTHILFVPCQSTFFVLSALRDSTGSCSGGLSQLSSMRVDTFRAAKVS